MELSRAMAEKNMTAVKVAEDLSLSVNAVRAWMMGRFGPPDPLRLQALNVYFGQKFLTVAPTTDLHKQPAPSDDNTFPLRLTIPEAKAALSQALGVPEDAIEIIVRF